MPPLVDSATFAAPVKAPWVSTLLFEGGLLNDSACAQESALEVSLGFI